MNKIKIIKAARQINAIIVMHHQFKQAYDGIIDLIHLNQLSDICYGGVVIAPSGCGKTSLIKLVQQKIAEDDAVPEGAVCLSIAAGANTNIGQLISNLMKQLGYQTIVRTSTISEQSSLLARTLRERSVIAVFIDESQHISRGKRTLSAAAITDWLKELRDASGVVIMMMGTREFVPLSASNDQLASRAPASFSLSEFQNDESWKGLLLKISQDVTEFDLKPITTFARKLHKATNGVPRTLKQLLIASTYAGMSSGKTAIDADSLKIGYASVFGNNPQQENIFGME
ncbi:ATP-binding protein [Herbaspirillum sp. B65]|jgi:type II secretory pathway predicted ATPase ExeA|uniref:ATP-binding protein n=1 Tax=Herbaspirillum sp. B65 TaxID=137708 RepID=UPI0005CA446D|nr:ATP-binding protein [Herbaspirillum sp. B65]